MSRMAGSKQRANIQGYVVVAEAEVIRKIRRLSAATTRNIFSQAKDHGSAPFMLDDQSFSVLRQSDHTFLCQPGDSHRFTL